MVRDRDGQYKHELKKKQREHNRLTEKLHQLLADKNPDRRIGSNYVLHDKLCFLVSDFTQFFMSCHGS